jgi:hypothetical protein
MKGISTVLRVLLALTGPALAWGSEGHRVVAEIAEQYLEPATARQVRGLLAIENATTLAQVATWADDIRAQRRETARWHFVDIPIHPPAGTPAAYDAARDCPRSDCIVAAIERFEGVLRDRSAPPRERLKALKFIVHFVADIDQPLHCADDGDRGGNDIRLIFRGRHTNLHAAMARVTMAVIRRCNALLWGAASARNVLRTRPAALARAACIMCGRL